MLGKHMPFHVPANPKLITQVADDASIPLVPFAVAPRDVPSFNPLSALRALGTGFSVGLKSLLRNEAFQALVADVLESKRPS